MAKTETNKINKVEQDNGSDTLINHNSLNKSGDNNNNNNNNKSAKTLNNSDSNNSNSNSNNIYLDPTLQNIDTTSIPTFPQAPHHAPPQDSSELTSPWWSAESTEVPDTTNSTSSTSDTNTNNTNNIKEPNNPLKSEELSHFFVSFSRQATDRKNGDTVWREDCLIWTKEPRHQKESKLVDEIKETAITRSQQQPSLSPLYSSSSSSSSSNINNDNDNSNQNNNTKKGYPLNTQCTMICLFRESQQRKLKKLKDMEMSNTWNPFYGNWLVLTKTRSAFAEHIAESDIVKKDSPDYYSVELGERFGHIGVDVTKFFAKTFTPVQELGRRYIESWNDGTQSRFFNRFFESAKRGDAFFLVRDSARRMVQNMMNTEKKKKEDDDHK